MRRLRECEKAAQLLRGPVLQAIDRATANSDCKGAIQQALSRLANALDDGRWPITEALLDEVIGLPLHDHIGRR